MKKHLIKLIFTFALVIGFSLNVSAQQDDKKKPPPKPKPPVIVPKEKPKPKEDDDDKKEKKKPEMIFGFIEMKSFDL
ncbi:MAG: hypothetical protein ACR2MD_15745 [Aridibacter sp.]